ncbi:hypothetical protein [Pyxidicoccus xibeiensis]|uniref:hypothetical protein n=1 Tax=Pyxidicoccus xibeiensis TaxID=2906759 RepID=UPI0020A709F9|nr:hypothetical protein [Pyxidicoccus xibeiensis]MCP3136570.1 hypothetical protein [Pyxidicoccus xibeiensis]
MKKDEPVPEPTPDDVARCLDVLRAVALLPDDHLVRLTVEHAATQVQRGMKKRLRRERSRATSEADRTAVQSLQARHRRMEEEGFSPPLDGADAAARVCEPLLQGLQGRPVYGRFLEDFREVPW